MVIAPRISDYVAGEVKRKTIRWMDREYGEGDCLGYHCVIAATPDRGVNRRISTEASERGIPINVVDDPELSTVIFPAIWREKSLTLAVSTGGAAPFMAAEIRTLLADFSKGLGQWVETGGRFREAVKKEISAADDKNTLYRRFLDAGPSKSAEAPPPDGTDLRDWTEWLDRIEKSRKQ